MGGQERQGSVEIELVGVIWEWGYLWCRGAKKFKNKKNRVLLFSVVRVGCV